MILRHIRTMSATGGAYRAFGTYPGTPNTENLSALILETEKSHIQYLKVAGLSPGVVFSHGLLSDINGTKAMALERFCRSVKRAYVRFSYQRDWHPASSANQTKPRPTLGLWKQNLLDVLDELTEGPQILVASSLGAWTAVLAALERPHRIAGIVGVASAPDFAGLTKMPLEKLDFSSRVPGAEGLLTAELLKEARTHHVLKGKGSINLQCPVRLIHGMDDLFVPWKWSKELAEALTSEDVQLTLVKGAGHFMNEPQQHDLLFRTLQEMINVAEVKTSSKM